MMLNIPFSRLKTSINKLLLPSPSLSNAGENDEEAYHTTVLYKNIYTRILKMTKADFIRRRNSSALCFFKTDIEFLYCVMTKFPMFICILEK
jgi:hypothetical protein